MSSEASCGKSFPLGSTPCDGGVNFSVYSKSGVGLDLLLFDSADDASPSEVIRLDPHSNRTFHYWHIFVPGIAAGQVYGYRAYGPNEPHRGMRFDPGKLLLDPYAKAVAVPEQYSRPAGKIAGGDPARAMKSVVVDLRGYDWEGDTQLKRPFTETVIYEMHLAGFTRHPNSGVPPARRGTYAGLIDSIPYLRDLGITAVELLPVFQFDAQDCPEGLTNYWGYSPVSFFAPHGGYCSIRHDPLAPLNEFRDMVKALHRAGIEVILDVVYNHTAEGDHTGPTFCFRGLENSVYYILESDRSRYANFTGTGNTLNANHPIVRRLILDSLRYWIQEMHVDGFRFDLASILSRDEQGQPLKNPPLVWDIELDPVLAGTKLIAEAWDAAGLYQVGSFVGDFWQEWNGRFRDDVRSFLRGDRGSVARLSARILGSPDLYGHEEREPEQSINFVTCHDGFTLNDLVSYDRKHNEANGEDNRDGSDQNLSWNCGVEGPTDNPQVESLRNRQVKNFLAVTFLALGTPMLLMGDEVRRTQRGNNNAYCQDNETSWFNWTLIERHRDVHRFVKMLVAHRLRRDMPRAARGTTLNELLRRARFEWHGVRLHKPDLRDVSHSIACTAWSTRGHFMTHTIFNAYGEALLFELPPVFAGPGNVWHRWIDTFRHSPHDIVEWDHAPRFEEPQYLVGPRSVVVLYSRMEGGEGIDPHSAPGSA